MDTRALLMGIGIGSALAYVFDPDSGERRRALARDKLVHGRKVARRAVGATATHLRNQARGVVASTTGRLRERNVDDVTLVERARAKLGRATSHAHAIDIQAEDGVLILRGPCLANDVPRVLATLAGVRGVKQVVNELDVHEVADTPPLQGGRVMRGGVEREAQPRWVPSRKALVGVGAMAAAGAAVAYVRR